MWGVGQVRQVGRVRQVGQVRKVGRVGQGSGPGVMGFATCGASEKGGLVCAVSRP